MAGAVLLPLVVLAATGRAQSEVAVVERSARLLLDTGSPYLPDPAGVDEYNPYLPGMSVFGLPDALLGQGPWTDARWCFAGVFVLTMAAALRIARHPVRRPLLLLSACPLAALPWPPAVSTCRWWGSSASVRPSPDVVTAGVRAWYWALPRR
ncbi:hypothetical protein NKH18_25710 [Streptomyces sp. M10(2022)]